MHYTLIRCEAFASGGVPAPAPGTFGFLLETGPGYLLLETGGFLLLE